MNFCAIKRACKFTLLVICLTLLFIGCAEKSQEEIETTGESKCMVTFLQEGQSDIVKEVRKGDALTDIPVPTEKLGYRVYWDRTDFSSITEDTVVTAIEEMMILPEHDYVDFIVHVESGREIRVLQLTDIQTIEARQKRYDARLDDNNLANLLNGYEKYIGQVIQAYQPDFIIMTGDNVYGEFDDSGYQQKELIRIMDSFKIPWAPVFGNHDNESYMGVDWQCQQFETSEYCLFKQRTLTGNGNYSVGLMQDGELKRVFYMLDSNGCGNMSMASYANGHSKKSVGFGVDQIQWYTDSITSLKEKYPNVKVSMAFHIQLAVFGDAFVKYGYHASTIKANPINLDKLPDAQSDGAFGYIGRPLKGSWDTDYAVWNGIKALGVDSIFVGHEHCNSASVVYEGVRLTYGQKSSRFDRYHSIENGVYNSNYQGDPVLGGTYINLSTDGSIADAGLYLYDKDVSYTPTEKAEGDSPPSSVRNVIKGCESYSIAALDGYQNMLSGQDSMFLAINNQSYSVKFALTPSVFNGNLVVSGFVESQTEQSEIRLTISSNKITIKNAVINYNLGKHTYNVTIGFANLYGGNTVCAFVLIDGQIVAWELLENTSLVSGNMIIASDTAGDEFVFSERNA